jgi:drug/metabolite transporter (DMT)-like permease
MNNRPANILLFLAYFANIFFFGSSWIFNKTVLVEGASPLWAATMRQGIAAIVFIIIFLIKRPKLNLTKAHIKLIIMYGVFMMALGHIFTLIGQQHIDSGLASIIFSFFPLAVVLISAILLPKQEPLTLKKIFGTLIGLIGIALLFYTQNMLKGNGYQLLGIGFVLLSVIVNSIPNVIIKRDGEHLDSLILNTGGMLIASVLLFSSALIIEGKPDFVLTNRMIFSVLYLGIICSAAGFFLYFWLLRHVSVFRMAITAYMTPLVAVFLGYIFYNEILSLNHYIGMLLIFTGIFIAEFKIRTKLKNKPESIIKD